MREHLYMMRKPGRFSLSLPSDCPGSPTTTKQGKPTMRISEKAVAFLLAVVISGTAFNTFIV